LAARAIRATALVDSAFQRYDRVRSVLIARFAPDAVLDAFNDLTYGASGIYKPDATNFRGDLFNWEKEAIARAFPPPPARVLIGGAGGGREAFALADRGYDVVAFDPAPDLARSMAAHASSKGRVSPWIGRYQDLPRLCPVAQQGDSIELRTQPRFHAAILGWTSFSHIRHRSARVRSLREMAAVTDGPVVISFYLAREPRRSGGRGLAGRLGLSGSLDQFTTHIGYYHLSTRSELLAEVEESGLDLLLDCYDDSDGRWPYIVVRRRS
jgi:hypothetical protein